MTNRVVLRTLIAMSTLLVLNGCKSDDAGDAKRNDPVLVIDQGQEPRETLRYEIAHGTRTTSTMEYGLASLATTTQGSQLSMTPGVRLHIVSGPSMEGKRGSTRFDVRIIKAEALVPEGVDPAVKLDLNKSVAVLNNVGGWVEVDDRGIVQRSDLNSAAKNPDVPARLLMMIINARTSLARVVLPAQPVGVGARWEAAKELLLYGFKINQADTYTMTEKVGDEVKLNVQIQQTAPKQTVTFEEEGVELTLEALTMNATGQVVLNLKALEANARASGEAADLLNVKTVDGSENIEIDSAFEVKMTVTYEIAETIEEGWEELEEAKEVQKAEEEAAEELEAQE
ncbi:MAG: hypothetical protein JSV06_03340 [Myxococcales bacterium]|nr:MAG: hypothetical protein JSV06_03340 [Myxococcales bacterium]